MQGKLLIFRPYQSSPAISEFTREPDIAEVRALVGGDLATVPGFLSIEHDGVVRRCVALHVWPRCGSKPVCSGSARASR